MRPHHKYTGVPKFLRGHHRRGKSVDSLDISARKKDYQNPDWLKRHLLLNWRPLSEIAKDLGVHEQTLRVYMSEGGITLNSLAEEKARSLNNALVFLPGCKAVSKVSSFDCSFHEDKVWVGHNAYYTTIRKVFVSGIGLGYLSNPIKGHWLHGRVTFRPFKDHYRLVDLVPTKIWLPRSLLTILGEEKMVDDIKRLYGDIDILWRE